jgi:BirA family transcriptional regulator, biotin operon repressor / biotin---[acetyl-CoA-carboxylase] ligase
VTLDALPATLWEGRAIAHWRAQWRVPELRVFDRIDSTNDVVRALAAAGAPAGSVVLAEVQTAGRGRFGRRWQAAAGSSLLLSVLLRPHARVGDVPGTIPLRTGLAAADAIEVAIGVRISLKWPNDLVIDGAGKLGGVLCEAVTAGDTWSIVAGIGINVRQRRDDWPPELRDSAISLDAASGAATDRAQLAAALIDHLRPLFATPLAPLSAAELERFRSRDVLAGRTVVVEDEGAGKIGPSAAGVTPSHRVGTSVGIAPDGALLLRTSSGTERITTGTVRIACEPGQRSGLTSYP